MKYRAVKLDSGDYNVYDVPVFGEVPAGEKYAPESIGRRWMSRAIREARRLERDQNYLPPLHVEHHMTGNPVEHAGYFRLRRITVMPVDGQDMAVLTADLLHIPAETFERIKAGRLPYRSVEVIDWDNPHINSLALLSTDEPFFRFPLLRRETMSVVEEGSPPSQAVAAHSRGPGALILFSMRSEPMPKTKTPSMDEVLEALKDPESAFAKRTLREFAKRQEQREEFRARLRARLEKSRRKDAKTDDEGDEDDTPGVDTPDHPPVDAPPKKRVEMADDEEDKDDEGGPISEILGEEPDGIPPAEEGSDDVPGGEPPVEPTTDPDVQPEPEAAPAADPTVTLEALAVQLKTLSQTVANIQSKIEANEKHGDPSPAEMAKLDASNDERAHLRAEAKLRKQVDEAEADLRKAGYFVSKVTRARLLSFAKRGDDALADYVASYKESALPDPRPITGQRRAQDDDRGAPPATDDPVLQEFARKGPEVYDAAVRLARDWEEARKHHNIRTSKQDFIAINIEAERAATRPA